jgi:hypothetical protein
MKSTYIYIYFLLLCSCCTPLDRDEQYFVNENTSISINHTDSKNNDIDFFTKAISDMKYSIFTYSQIGDITYIRIYISNSFFLCSPGVSEPFNHIEISAETSPKSGDEFIVTSFGGELQAENNQQLYLNSYGFVFSDSSSEPEVNGTVTISNLSSTSFSGQININVAGSQATIINNDELTPQEINITGDISEASGCFGL